MSARSEKAVFLARASYRQRRLRDAMKVLPVVGVILWLFPLLWQGEGGTAVAVQYVFGVWVLLIALAAFLSAKLVPEAVGEASEDTD